MEILRRTLYVCAEVGLPVLLTHVSGRVYMLANASELLAAHARECRTFGDAMGNMIMYPEVIDGKFQRSHYFGDPDSHNSRWVQMLLLSGGSEAGPYYVEVVREYARRPSSAHGALEVVPYDLVAQRSLWQSGVVLLQ